MQTFPLIAININGLSDIEKIAIGSPIACALRCYPRLANQC